LIDLTQRQQRHATLAAARAIVHAPGDDGAARCAARAAWSDRFGARRGAEWSAFLATVRERAEVDTAGYSTAMRRVAVATRDPDIFGADALQLVTVGSPAASVAFALRDACRLHVAHVDDAAVGLYRYLYPTAGITNVYEQPPEQHPFGSRADVLHVDCDGLGRVYRRSRRGDLRGTADALARAGAIADDYGRPALVSVVCDLAARRRLADDVRRTVEALVARGYVVGWRDLDGGRRSAIRRRRVGIVACARPEPVGRFLHGAVGDPQLDRKNAGKRARAARELDARIERSEGPIPWQVDVSADAARGIIRPVDILYHPAPAHFEGRAPVGVRVTDERGMRTLTAEELESAMRLPRRWTARVDTGERVPERARTQALALDDPPCLYDPLVRAVGALETT